MPRVIEQFDEFVIRMACEYMVVSRGDFNQRIVFESGAVSDGGHNHHEPSTDPKAILQVKREFLKAKLTRETKDFHKYKNHITEQESAHRRFPNSCPAGVNSETVRTLREGQERILKLREQLAEIEEQLTDPEEKRKQEELQAYLSKQRMQNDELFQEFQRIEI